MEKKLQTTILLGLCRGYYKKDLVFQQVRIGASEEVVVVVDTCVVTVRLVAVVLWVAVVLEVLLRDSVELEVLEVVKVEVLLVCVQEVLVDVSVCVCARASSFQVLPSLPALKVTGQVTDKQTIHRRRSQFGVGLVLKHPILRRSLHAYRHMCIHTYMYIYIYMYIFGFVYRFTFIF